jgi:hypothetical protein
MLLLLSLRETTEIARMPVLLLPNYLVQLGQV